MGGLTERTRRNRLEEIARDRAASAAYLRAEGIPNYKEDTTMGDYEIINYDWGLCGRTQWRLYGDGGDTPCLLKAHSWYGLAEVAGIPAEVAGRVYETASGIWAGENWAQFRREGNEPLQTCVDCFMDLGPEGQAEVEDPARETPTYQALGDERALRIQEALAGTQYDGQPDYPTERWKLLVNLEVKAQVFDAHADEVAGIASVALPSAAVPGGDIVRKLADTVEARELAETIQIRRGCASISPDICEDDHDLVRDAVEGRLAVAGCVHLIPAVVEEIVERYRQHAEDLLAAHERGEL